MKTHFSKIGFYLLVTLIFFALILLGVWQLNRASYKKLLQQQWLQRSYITLTAKDLVSAKKDLSYYHVTLDGEFDNTHTVLIDNKIVDHKIGYYIFTPFELFETHHLLWVNRGWTARPRGPSSLPVVAPILGAQTISGNLMPFEKPAFQLGKDQFTGQWPWIVQQLPLQTLSQLLKKPFYPYQLNLDGAKVANRNLRSEKHIAYAFQWFALAITFLISCIFLMIKNRQKKPL